MTNEAPRRVRLANLKLANSTPLCEARRKSDHEPCRAHALKNKKRGKFHRGASTGPRAKYLPDAFVSEARSWPEPLQQILDAEEARWRALECTTADDFPTHVPVGLTQ